MAEDLEYTARVASVAYVRGGYFGRCAVTRSRDISHDLSLVPRSLDLSQVTRLRDLSRDLFLTPRSRADLSRDLSLVTRSCDLSRDSSLVTRSRDLSLAPFPILHKVNELRFEAECAAVIHFRWSRPCAKLTSDAIHVFRNVFGANIHDYPYLTIHLDSRFPREWNL
jgi:hypothetical protein